MCAVVLTCMRERVEDRVVYRYIATVQYGGGSRFIRARYYPIDRGASLDTGQRTMDEMLSDAENQTRTQGVNRAMTTAAAHRSKGVSTYVSKKDPRPAREKMSIVNCHNITQKIA